MSEPKRVTAIGGIFIKCQDPAAQREWYGKHLGFVTDQYGTSFEWRHIDAPERKGYSVWSTFKADTDYFGPAGKDHMLNLRVADLEWLLVQLKENGIEQEGETQVYEYGKFAHVTDPEGNRIELWEANDEEYGKMIGGVVTR